VGEAPRGCRLFWAGTPERLQPEEILLSVTATGAFSRAFWRCSMARRMVLRVDYLPNRAREPVADGVQILVRLGNSTMVPRSLVKSSGRPMHRSQTQSNNCCYGPSVMRARAPYRPPLNIEQTETKGGVAPRKGCDANHLSGQAGMR
jgi:hypothetical protein